MKGLIVDSTTNVIYHIADNITNDVTKGGYYISSENLVYPYTLGVTLYESAIVPSDVAIQTHTYDGTTFTKNENYEKTFDIEVVVKQQQEIIDRLLIDSLMGGN